MYIRAAFLLFHPIPGIIQPTQFHHPELQPLRRSEGQGLFVVSACEQAFHCAPLNNMFAINMTPQWQKRRELKASNQEEKSGASELRIARPEADRDHNRDYDKLPCINQMGQSEINVFAADCQCRNLTRLRSPSEP